MHKKYTNNHVDGIILNASNVKLNFPIRKRHTCTSAVFIELQYYRAHKKLPSFPRYTGAFSLADMKPLREQDIQNLPHWSKVCVYELTWEI